MGFACQIWKDANNSGVYKKNRSLVVKTREHTNKGRFGLRAQVEQRQPGGTVFEYPE